MASIIAPTRPAVQEPPIIPKPAAAPKVAQPDSSDSKDSVRISGHAMLPYSNKTTLTQAIVEILSHPTEKTVARIVNLAAVLDMPQSIQEATPLEVVKSLGAFLADKK